jgi:hypothetical protein
MGRGQIAQDAVVAVAMTVVIIGLLYLALQLFMFN